MAGSRLRRLLVPLGRSAAGLIHLLCWSLVTVTRGLRQDGVLLGLGLRQSAALLRRSAVALGRGIVVLAQGLGCFLGRLRRVAAQASQAGVLVANPAGHRGHPGRQGHPDRRGHTVAPRRTPFHRWGRRRTARSGPGAPVLVVASLMVLIVAMLGVEQVTGTSLLPDRIGAGLRPPPRKFPVLAASPPVELEIQALDLRAPVHHVGLAADGTIGVPDAKRAQEAAWYDQGPTPGQYGPAVIVGHVDTTNGPAVFHDLKRLRAGDRIEVDRADRSVAVFEVNAVERFGKERLPVDEVFGDFSRPNLRLITCGGRWVGGATGYADNVVVFASLVQARHP
ncbi:Sortase family protein [Micromonospora pallida]|uniref:Sortase family protein n=1 Tax=Micromonospora pallida TaxID=145854 RepID=A0A1C6TJ35_9ACTN|nr:class F sortase [Micromonospora pallida]SCL41754.1 Sortase family protein [Micromonospora pallida]